MNFTEKRPSLLHLAILTLLILSGCSKYEEGPFISFRSAWNRVQGEYFMAKVLVNDEDKTDDYYNSSAYYETWKFYPCEGDEYMCLKVGDDFVDESTWGHLAYTNRGTYYKSNKSKIHIGCGSFGSSSCNLISQQHSYGPINQTLVEWDIIKLRDKKMYFRVDWTDGNTYEIHLKER